MRLFLALLPSPAATAALARTALEVQSTCGGRATPAENLHVTLAFLGEVAPARLPAVEDACAAAGGAPFTVSLDHLCAVRDMVWAGGTAPAGLVNLVADLHRHLVGAGVGLDARPFRLHVTLVRRALRALPAVAWQPVQWPAGHFSLMQSRPGPRGPVYFELRSWGLTARG